MEEKMKKTVKKIMFAFLCLLCLATIVSEPSMKLSGMDVILYKAYISIFLLSITIGLGLHIKKSRNTKFWIITVSIGLILSAIPYSILSSDAKLEIKMNTEENSSNRNTDKEQYDNQSSKAQDDKKEEKQEKQENSEHDDKEIEKQEEIADDSKLQGEKTIEEELTGPIQEGDPLVYTFDEAYDKVGNICINLNKIEVNSKVWRGIYSNWVRFYVDIKNDSSEEQYWRAEKTPNIIGDFLGQENTIMRFDNIKAFIKWKDGDVNATNAGTLQGNEQKEYVIQTSFYTDDPLNYEDNLQFDLYFKNNDESLVININQ